MTAELALQAPPKKRTGIAIAVFFISYVALHACYALAAAAIMWLAIRYDHSSAGGLIGLLLYAAANFLAGLGAPIATFRFFPSADRPAVIYAFSTGMIVLATFAILFSIGRQDGKFVLDFVECGLAVTGAWVGRLFVVKS